MSGTIYKTAICLLTLGGIAVLSGCAMQPVDRDAPQARPAVREGAAPENPYRARVGRIDYGKAAFYSDRLVGRSTASGEPYDRNAFTAAHATFPFGTICEVTNMANDLSVRVRINDRFRSEHGRIIDLSYAAAEELRAIQAGVVNVRVLVIR